MTEGSGFCTTAPSPSSREKKPTPRQRTRPVPRGVAQAAGTGSKGRGRLRRGSLGRTEGPALPGLLGGRAGGNGAGSRSTGRSERLCFLALSGVRTVCANPLTRRAHVQPGEAEV